MEPDLRLDALSDRHRVRILVNGGVLAVGGGEGRELDAKVALDEWLQPLQNRLRLEVTPAPDAGADRPVRVAVKPRSELEADVLKVDWACAAGAAAGPFAAVLPFAFKAVLRTRALKDALAFDLPGPDAPRFGEPEREAVVRLGLALREAMAAKDAPALAELLAYRLEEHARAYEEASDLVADLLRIADRDAFALVPVRAEDVQVKLLWGGRLARLNANGRPLVETVPTRYFAPAGVEVYAAFVEDRWQIARTTGPLVL